MQFSVWNEQAAAYDYYEAPGRVEFPPDPTHLRAKPLGLTVEQAAWPLPKGSKLVGRGKYPKGLVAAEKVALGAVDFLDPNTHKILALGLVAYLAWRYFR